MMHFNNADVNEDDDEKISGIHESMLLSEAD